jgi:methyl coenzyme M reductase subunit C-like uncharacterized protein (methanogenesis marker protein 7)
METPVEILKHQLALIKHRLHIGKGMSQKKRDSKRLIPEYEAAINILTSEEECIENEFTYLRNHFERFMRWQESQDIDQFDDQAKTIDKYLKTIKDE